MKLNKTITITLSGEDESDIELAFEEVVRVINEGYTNGFNENETGSYKFETTEEEGESAVETEEE